MTAHHQQTPDYGTGEKKLSVYLFGTVLCILLTLIPFYLVMKPVLTRSSTLILLYGFAIAQFFTQVLCFLRLNTKTPQAKMNSMSFLFTLVILFVVIGGSLWIMWNLNYRMM